MHHRVLLTSVCRPFGGPGEGDSVGAELFHAQVTRAQGPFSLRQTIRVWGIDYLASNIQAPTVTLHYPSKREFVRELESDRYTHVGINFVVATFHKVREMVALVRRHAPDATVVLGGYGTVLPDEILRPYADAICREEGIGFMRRLLGEDVDRPIVHPHAPVPSVGAFGLRSQVVVGHVTAGLGCPNGCDFCSTSYFFNRRYERLCESGRDLYEALIATKRRALADEVQMGHHVIIDEDFFLHHRRAREFLACVREGGEPLSLMGFGSVRGLSKFTSRELAEMGFDFIWNGFEGTRAGYGKQKGRPLGELYADLRSIGCATLSSMIIGFPYQDEARMRAEFEELMALEPTMIQCLIYFAFPGTPFHAQVTREGRYRDKYATNPDLRRWDGFAMHFDHPKFDDPSDVERLQTEFYASDFQRLGPTPLRLAKVWLEGYRTLRHDRNPLLAARAERLGRTSRMVLGLITDRMLATYPPHQRAQWAKLRRDIIDLTGELSPRERFFDIAAPTLGRIVGAAAKARFLQQPGLLRTVHRMPGAEASQHTSRTFLLRGGHHSGFLGALVEDLGERARQALGRWFPALSGETFPFEPAETNPVTAASREMGPSRTSTTPGPKSSTSSPDRRSLPAGHR